MPNTNNPTGFLIAGQMSAPATNYSFQTIPRKIAAAYGTKLHRGTPVIDASGYIQAATAGTTQLAGIFMGCSYYSTSAKKWVWSWYWPAGTPTNADADAWVIDDENVTFKVQTDGTAAVPFSAIGQNIQLVVGTGNDVTGLSGYMANHTPAVTATYPFRMVGLLSQGAIPATDGADDTQPYNQILVRLNNCDRRSMTGIA